MKSVHKAALRSVISAMKSAAEHWGVAIDTRAGNIGAAFAEQAFIANAQIRGTEALTAIQLTEGLPLLFVYLAIPKGARVAKKRIPDGFYVVNVRADIRAKRARASLIDEAGASIVSLPVAVQIGGHLHSVSGSFSRCHVTADVGFRIAKRPIVLTVSVKWC